MTISPPAATPAAGVPNLPWHRLGLSLVLTRVTGQALEFVAFALLARKLGAADFGRLSLAFLACRYGGLVADWGASIGGVRDTAADPGGASIRPLLRRRNSATAVLTAGYVAVVAIGGWPELTLLGMVLAARGLNRDWLALGRQRGVRAGLPAIVQGGTVALGTVAFARGLTSAAAAVAVAYAVGLAV